MSTVNTNICIGGCLDGKKVDVPEHAQFFRVPARDICTSVPSSFTSDAAHVRDHRYVLEAVVMGSTKYTFWKPEREDWTQRPFMDMLLERYSVLATTVAAVKDYIGDEGINEAKEQYRS